MRDLCHEHGSGRDLHVVTELEVLQESDGLRHADVTIDLEAHVCHWISRVHIPYDVFRYYVQARALYKYY